MILAPLAAMLVQMAISRTREYAADRAGAEISGHPLWLARALQKIERLARGTVNRDAERSPASAHLFIVNPLHMGGVDNLFRTHPSTEDRVRRLREMAGSTDLPRPPPADPGAEPERCLSLAAIIAPAPGLGMPQHGDFVASQPPRRPRQPWPLLLPLEHSSFAWP